MSRPLDGFENLSPNGHPLATLPPVVSSTPTLAKARPIAPPTNAERWPLAALRANPGLKAPPRWRRPPRLSVND